MPLPLVKVAIVTVRTFIRPFNTVLTRRLRHNASEREKDLFYWFGMKVYKFENKIDQILTEQQEHDSGIQVVTHDLEKISRPKAINRGVETFVELTFFYGLLMSIAFWDMYKTFNKGKQ